ncbi:MAG: hypothetical protein ACTTJE_06175 [Schwartzia sp. (in: firmicutes)]
MWKKICMLGMTAIFAGTMLAGCGEKAPAKPVDPPLASFSVGSSQAKLYEMKGEVEVPKLYRDRDFAAAVTEDSIYVFAEPSKQDENLLKRIRFEGNTLLSIADVGKSRDPYVYANKKYAWFRTVEGKQELLNVFDGEKLTTTPYTVGLAPFGTVLSDAVYVEYGSSILDGTFEGSVFKKGQTILTKWWDLMKARKEEPENLAGADSTAFYLRAHLKEDKKQGTEASTRLYAYTRDGKEVRGFDLNGTPGQGVQARRRNLKECVAVTEDYVVFTSFSFVRVFKKQDGAYVGDFSLQVNDDKFSVLVAVPMGKNDILILCHEQPSKIYRLSL